MQLYMLYANCNLALTNTGIKMGPHLLYFSIVHYRLCNVQLVFTKLLTEIISSVCGSDVLSSGLIYVVVIVTFVIKFSSIRRIVSTV